MKKKGLQLISVFLILSIGLSVCNLAYAETADTDQNIEAFNVDVITDIDTQTESLQMLWSEGDLYIRTSDVEKVTRYQYVNMNEDYVIYKLGEKYIDFSLKDDRVLMPEQSYTGKYGGALAYNGEYYLSLSTILPWLNAECENVKGKLLISSSAFEPSYYELCEYYTKYIMPFTNIEDYIGGNEKNNFLTLCGVMAANNLINFKSSVRKAFVTAAQYDSNPEYYSYEAYISAFIDMASNNSFSSNIAKKLMKGCKTLGKVNTLTKGMGIDLTELQIDDSVAAFMAEYGFDAEFQNLAYDFVDVVRGANTIAQQSQYIEPLAESVATFSAAFNTTKEYKDALQLLADEAKENTVLKDSAIDALSRIKNPYSVLYKKYMEFALDKGVDKLIIEKAVMKFMNFKVTDASLFITKMIIPNEFKAIDAYSKIIVYGDIEALSLDLVGSPRKAVEPEQQYTKRIGMLMKTLSVKKTLEALKSWKKMILDEKMLTKQIEHCDEMVLLLGLCNQAGESSLMQPSKENPSLLQWEASANIYREAFKDVKKGHSVNKPEYITDYLGMTLNQVAEIWGEDYEMQLDTWDMEDGAVVMRYKDDRFPCILATVMDWETYQQYTSGERNFTGEEHIGCLSISGDGPAYMIVKGLSNRDTYADLIKKYPDSRLYEDSIYGGTTCCISTDKYRINYVWDTGDYKSDVADYVICFLSPGRITEEDAVQIAKEYMGENQDLYGYFVEDTYSFEGKLYYAVKISFAYDGHSSYAFHLFVEVNGDTVREGTWSGGAYHISD